MAPGKRLIAGDLAGNVWVFGIAGVTVLMLVWARRYRRRAPEEAATTSGVPAAAGSPS
jgi:N-acetyl-1-D-myo-inositol-2-amino-2-deoxy-alpha-D-glucopyranoside deacetylase